MAYVADWSSCNIRVEGSLKIHIVNYAFALIKNGKVAVDNLIYLNKIKELKSYNTNLKIVLSIGGWGADGFSQVARLRESRVHFANSIKEVIREYDFDGVDIDWEFPGSSDAGIVASEEDKYNFTLLIEEIKKVLYKMEEKSCKKYILSIAVGGFQKAADNLEIYKLNSLVDYCNIMTYDFAGGKRLLNHRHHTNLYGISKLDKVSAHEAVKIYINGGMDKEKILIGAGFYGRGINNVNIRNGELEVKEGKEPKGTSLTYTEIDKILRGKNSYKRYWDKYSKAPWLYDGDTYISYDDEKSIGYKCAYIKDCGLAGLMFWEYNQDETGKLLNKIYTALK